MDLRDRLEAAAYTVDGVIELIGELGQSGLTRNTTVAARRALAGNDSPLATLTRLFVLQDSVPASAAERVLGSASGEVCNIVGDQARARVDIRPYASPDDVATGYLVSDLTPGLDGAPAIPSDDYVLGANPASRQLAELVVRRRVAKALDLGTGCGVQSLHLARHAERIVATDLNPRAETLARKTFELNGLDIDLRLGDLYAPVAEETFDLIVTNPPYVMTPPDAAHLIYREQGVSAGEPADAFVRRVVREGARRLTNGGLLQVLGNWAITDEANLPDATWIDVPCDLFVVERERLDPTEYIEMWLADAGLLGHPEWRERYEAWLDFFDERGVLAVGLGWINARRISEGSIPDVRAERWSYAVHNPGEAVAAHFDAVNALRCAPTTAALLARAWRVAPEVDVETVADPGTNDPRTIVYRSRRGMRRAVQADTWLAAVLSAADGDLPLGAITAAVDELVGIGNDGAAETRYARLRECVALGLLI